jgi:hypothetical protein
LFEKNYKQKYNASFNDSFTSNNADWFDAECRLLKNRYLDAFNILTIVMM